MYHVQRFDPFRSAARAFGQPWLQFGEPAQSGGWSPAMDVTESATAYEVTVELPGVAREAVEVTYENGLLRITGEKSAVREQSEPRLRRVERSYGSFERSLRVRGPVDAERITAQFADGVMTVTLPKAPEAVAKQIAVSG